MDRPEHRDSDPRLRPDSAARQLRRGGRCQARLPAGLALSLALAGTAGGCLSVANQPIPTGRPTVDPSLVAQRGSGEPPAPPSAAASPQIYVVRRGDTLQRIADRYGLTVGQLLAANPSITDPNLIAVGQVLVIPPPDAPDTGPNSSEFVDVRDDVTDLDGQAIPSKSYVDMTSVGASLDASRRLVVEIRLVHAPPIRLDPSVETVTYTVEIDTQGDDEPDYRLVYANDAAGDGRFVPALEDRTSGRIRSGDGFPGVVEGSERTLRFGINRAALGDPRQYRLAFKVERQFFPNGVDDSSTESSTDLAPDQQWPRPNPRWIEIGGI
jgi:LysM repeat protein